MTWVFQWCRYDQPKKEQYETNKNKSIVSLTSMSTLREVIFGLDPLMIVSLIKSLLINNYYHQMWMFYRFNCVIAVRGMCVRRKRTKETFSQGVMKKRIEQIFFSSTRTKKLLMRITLQKNKNFLVVLFFSFLFCSQFLFSV